MQRGFNGEPAYAFCVILWKQQGVSTANGSDGSAQQMGQHSKWISTADGSAQQMDWHSRSGTDLGQVEFFYTYEQI